MFLLLFTHILCVAVPFRRFHKLLFRISCRGIFCLGFRDRLYCDVKHALSCAEMHRITAWNGLYRTLIKPISQDRQSVCILAYRCNEVTASELSATHLFPVFPESEPFVQKYRTYDDERFNNTIFLVVVFYIRHKSASWRSMQLFVCGHGIFISVN